MTRNNTIQDIDGYLIDHGVCAEQTCADEDYDGGPQYGEGHGAGQTFDTGYDYTSKDGKGWGGGSGSGHGFSDGSGKG